MNDRAPSRERLLEEIARLSKKVAELEEAAEHRAPRSGLPAAEAYRDLVERAGIAILVDDEEGKFRYCNQRFADLFEYSLEEIGKRSIAELVHPGDLERVMMLHRDRVAGRSAAAQYEFRGVTRVGAVVHLGVNAVPLRDAGKIVGTRSYLWEVSNRREAESTLLAARERVLLGRLIDSAPVAVLLTANDGRGLRANRAFESLFGYRESEILGQGVDGLIVPPGLRAEALALTAQAGRGEQGTFEVTRRHKSGREIEVTVAFAPIMLEGEQMAVFAIYTDLTARKQAEEQLRHSLLWYEAIFSGSRDAIFISDEKARFLEVNDAACQLTGFTREELLCMRISDLHEEVDLDAFRRFHERIFNGEDVLSEARVLRKDGSKVDTEFSNRRVIIGGERFMHTVGRDISERRRTDEVLRETSEALRAVIATSPLAIITLDVRGQVTSWNPAATSMFGWSAEETMGGPVPFVPEDKLPEFQGLLGHALGGRALTGVEVTRRRRDGSDIEIRLNTAPLRDAGGHPVGVMAIIEDVGERKQLEEQVRLVHKFEAVGRLAGGVAHDFNNILQAILGECELAAEDLPEGNPTRTSIEEIRRSGQRAAELTRQLLAFGRKQVLQPRTLDLNKLVADIGKMLRRLIGEDVELHTELAAGIGLVEIDPTQLEQVVMNLAVNARDAMPRGGKLTLETANVDLDEAFVSHHLGSRPGPHVMLVVSDTGTGMDEATRSHLFEPFFTTKARGKGTGLGLAMVYGIVKQSGGSIYAYSEPGEGTTFKVFLPRADADPTEDVSRYQPVASLRGPETILLAEDDKGVRATLRKMLDQHGYAVIEAPTVEDAILVAEKHPGPIHLLLTDVVMPGMGGRELADRLCALRPRMRVLFMSGYTDDAIVRHGILERELAFLQKPFTTNALLTKVRATLDG